VNERSFAVNGFQPGGDHCRIAAHQDQRALAHFAHSAHRVGEGRRVALDRLDREAIERQVHAHVVHFVGFGGGHLRFDRVERLVVAHAHEQPRFVEEALLVAEHHRLVARFDLVAVGFERHQAHRRLRGSGELLFRFVADVGAGRKLSLFSGQLHGEGHAGGEAAFFAVGLRQQLVDLNA